MNYKQAGGSEPHCSSSNLLLFESIGLFKLKSFSCYCSFAAQKMKFSIKDFFSKCDQIPSWVRFKTFIFCWTEIDSLKRNKNCFLFKK